MVDFNKPAKEDLYTEVLQEIRSGWDSLAKMLDGTSDTNIPDGAFRVNSGQGFRLEQRVGGSWTGRSPQLNNLPTNLTGLTSGEVNQLQNINTITISNTQWGYLGSLSAPPVQETRTISSGGGLTGGGNLSANRTLSINVGVTAGNGLTGGGTLTQTRTVTLGTPGTVNGGTSNNVTSSGHTHAVSSTTSRTNSSTSTLLAAAGMNNHRTSGDHDGRYYTKSEVGHIETSGPIALGGDFDSDARILCTRVGQQVTITAYSASGSIFIGLNSSLSQPTSSSGVVPAQFRPANGNYASMRDSISDRRINARVFSNGEINVNIWWLDGSSSSAATATINTFSITYNITPS